MSRCTLARRDQPQVYPLRRTRVETFVYGQTQRIEFGRILVIHGSYHRDSNQASLAMPSVAKFRKKPWRVVTTILCYRW
jgi:hypothetical protein